MILIINSFDRTTKLYDDWSFRLKKSYRSPRAVDWEQISGVGLIVPNLPDRSGIIKVTDPGRDTNYYAKQLLAKIPPTKSVFYIDGNAVLRNIPFEDDEPVFDTPVGLTHQELLQLGLAKAGLSLHSSQVITAILDGEFSLVAWNKGAPVELFTKELLSVEGLNALLKPKLRQNPGIILKLKRYLKELTFGIGGLALFLGRVDGVFMSGKLANSPNLVREGLLLSLKSFPTTHIVTAEIDPLAEAARMVSQLL